MKAVPFSRRQAVQGAVAVSLIINLMMMMGVFYGRSHSFMSEMQVGWKLYLTFFLWHFFCNLFLVFVLFMYDFRIVKTNKNKLKQRLWIACGTILICSILSPGLAKLQWWALGGNPGIGENGFILFNVVRDLMVGIVVTVITNNIYLTYKREQTMLANHTLMADNTRIRHEALKNHVAPHFLFTPFHILHRPIGA